jgi:Zn-dependent protease with chaperone function
MNYYEEMTKNKRFGLLFALGFGLSLAFVFFSMFFFLRKLNSRMDWLLSTASVLFILGTALWRYRLLKEGGSTYLASIVKAVPLGDDGLLEPLGGGPQEKILRNVVAEMSVAAAVPEPDIYLLPNDESINAMAAGLHLDDSAVIVTKGALRLLDRDEISALVAHEFSHLVNKDTSRYTMMSGFLHGLFNFRNAAYYFLTKFPKMFGLLLSLMALGVGLAASLAGRLLQTAFCRSREYLADASAVQFTRNPKALASLLKKIGGQNPPKARREERLPELSHIYLSQPEEKAAAISILSFINLDTHPPIHDRIWAIDPRWDGWYWDFEKDPVDNFSRPGPVESPAGAVAEAGSSNSPQLC